MNQSYYDESFDNVQKLEHGEYENCLIQNCILSESDLSDYKFIDCQFKDCDLSMSKVHKTAFRNVDFTSCKLVGIKFDVCHEFLLSFSFEECTLDYAYFSQSKIPKTKFINCQLHEVDFSECDLTHASFEKSNMDRAIFNRSLLKNTDFSTAYNLKIDPMQNDIAGAKFSMESAIGLLSNFNIQII